MTDIGAGDPRDVHAAARELREHAEQTRRDTRQGQKPTDPKPTR